MILKEETRTGCSVVESVSELPNPQCWSLCLSLQTWWILATSHGFLNQPLSFLSVIKLVVVRCRMSRSLDAYPSGNLAHHTCKSGSTRELELLFKMNHVEVEIEVSMGTSRL